MEFKKELEEKLAESLFNLNKEWKNVLTEGGEGSISSSLKKCFRQVAEDLIEKGVTKKNIIQNGLDEYIRPRVSDILKCFSFTPPSKTNVIILGEDPYPQKCMADGLSFSFTGMAKKSSLENILRCLKKHRLIDEIPEYVAGLDCYASQGVLLMNKNLTRTPEICTNNNSAYINNNGSKNKKNNHNFWEVFTTKIVKYLLDLHKERGLIVLVLGNKHEDIINLVKEYKSEKLVALHWNHPSPMSVLNNNPENPKHFENCPHFVTINNFLAELELDIVNWDPSAKIKLPRNIKYLAFGSDGGCKNNLLGAGDKYLEVGASAAYFPTVIKREKNSHKGMFSSHIFAYKYVFNEEKNAIEIDQSEKISVNNDRAEILGACLGLLEIYKYLSERGNDNDYIIYIVVDNMHVFNLINNYEKISGDSSSKDLELILQNLMYKLSDILGEDIIDNEKKVHISSTDGLKYDLNKIGITVIHQPSHGKPEEYKHFRRELFDINHTVDAEVVKLVGEYNSRK